MHPTALLALLALAPTLALTSPLFTPSSSTGTTSPLVRRGGIDFCGQNLPRAGDACAFGSSETQPHACSIDDETVVLKCRDGRWAVDHACPASQSCRCDRGTPVTGNLVCRG